MSSRLFSSEQVLSDLQNQGPSQKSKTGAALTEEGIIDVDSWKHDQPGDGLRSTQQLSIDWSNFAKHTTFMPASAKVNLAFDRIINGYPFDGTAIEVENFHAGLTGFENYVLSNFPRSTGSLNFISDEEVYLEGKDRSGFLFPSLARDLSGKAVLSDKVSLKPFTLEAQIAIPTGSFDTGNQVIFQFLSTDGYQGMSLLLSESLSSDPTAKLMLVLSSGSSDTGDDAVRDVWISGSVTKGQYNHVAFTYDRGLYERLTMYKNGDLLTSSYKQLEITGGLGLGNSSFYIGTGSSHLARLGFDPAGFVPAQTFTGSLDEFRFWSEVRSQEQIRRYSTRNVYNEENLKLYYRFNEPASRGLTTVYKSKNVCLDYSGNGLHGILSNYVDACRDDHYDNPITLEKLNQNPCLFPDHEDLIYYNSQLLLTASRFDANNPNMITKLVPRHYFAEAKFFEGRENDEGEVLETYGYSNASYGGNEYTLPRYGEIPQAQLLTSFLLIWANFFDDLKLYLDTFSKIRAANHNQYDTIPLQFMPAMAAVYDIDLPNAFSEFSADKFRDGQNVSAAGGQSEAGLTEVLAQMWRRTLTELPFLLRSRGTIQSIRSLMAAMGINLETSFRIREFGGSNDLSITGRRKRRTADYSFLDMKTAVSFLTSSDLSIYRHAPGPPWGGPAEETLHFQSAGIKVVTPAEPPVLTQITSASWAWEAHYKLDNDPLILTQSLFRLESIGTPGQRNMILNLLAMREKSEVSPNYKVQLLVSQSNTRHQKIELKDVNCWDGARWYFNVNHTKGPVSSSFDLRVNRANIDNVSLQFSGSQEYLNDSGSLLVHMQHQNPDGVYMGIGSHGKTYGSLYLNSHASSSYSDFTGQVGGMRLWSKALTPKEAEEHALNFNSIGVEDPMVNNNYPISNENIILAQYPAKFTEPIIEGSWERVRGQYELYQDNVTGSSGRLLVIDDISKNGIELHCHMNSDDGKGIIRVPTMYSIIDPNWDLNSTHRKVRVRSYQDFEKAQRHGQKHGALYSIEGYETTDDRRFAIEASMVQGLNEDIVNTLADMSVLNEYLGAPEMEYAVVYPELAKMSEKYFMRLTEPVNYDALFKFFSWFNLKFGPMIESFLPRTVQFLGVNFVVESHILERNKFEYKQGDVHVDIFARRAVEIEPLFIGTIRSEIS